ncbi:MAG: translocase [Planctomycetota bacterium]|nr:translocase [Planctomycetota bacterium]
MFKISNLFHWGTALGRPTAARLSRYWSTANQVLRMQEDFRGLSDGELLTCGRDIQWRARTGIPLSTLLVEAFALVRETSRRTNKMEHFPVQVIGGHSLFEGNIAEMQTGEGKTLTATLVAFLRALPGRGCHVITVNDYLANRDAETMGPIYEALGLSVGKILTPMEPDERRENYAKDITYGTAKEFGFDFLRDRLRMGAIADDDTLIKTRKFSGGGLTSASEQPVQRGHYFALVDEADSILIDEARTPLIIGLTQPNDPATVNLFRWSNRATFHLESNVDYVYEPDRRSAYLTDAGCRRVLLMAKPSLLDSLDTEKIYGQVEKALTAQNGFMKDRDYVIVEDKITIVDESTGRLMDGRKWQDGLHQAVEAKELVPITAATGQAARVTVQAFFRRYEHLCGMTGTAMLAKREIRRTYYTSVTPIPTHRPCIRAGLPYRVFITQQKKREAIAVACERVLADGRSILIGTPSVEASEGLASVLRDRSIQHQILNAKFHEQEADIVAHAGEPGRVTIATNMAGRGTDIILEQHVRDSGGLHVIATEMHSSSRIDRQLIGRAARQGDPGSFQFFLSLEDELLRCLEPHKVERRRKSASPDANGELSSTWVGFFRRTQRFLQRTHVKQRKQLQKQEKHRSQQYRSMGLDPFLELTE